MSGAVWGRVPIYVRTWWPGCVDVVRLRRDILEFVSDPTMAGVFVELCVVGRTRPWLDDLGGVPAMWVDLARHAGSMSVLAVPSVLRDWQRLIAAAKTQAAAEAA